MVFGEVREMTTSDSELRLFFKSRTDAQQSKDINRLMRHYAPDIVYYDVIPPLRFTGINEVRRNFMRWFDGYDGPITLETHDFSVVTNGDLAYANMFHLDSGTRTNGFQTSIWIRETVCLRRSSGRWLILHEHISVPFSPDDLHVWLASDKDQQL